MSKHEVWQIVGTVLTVLILAGLVTLVVHLWAITIPLSMIIDLEGIGIVAGVVFIAIWTLERNCTFREVKTC